MRSARGMLIVAQAVIVPVHNVQLHQLDPDHQPCDGIFTQAVVVFMHGTWVSPEVYGLQLDRLAAGARSWSLTRRQLPTLMPPPGQTVMACRGKTEPDVLSPSGILNAAGGVLVLAPCGVEGLSGFAQFFNPDMKKFQSAYQARGRRPA